jgi:hypothetical protein
LGGNEKLEEVGGMRPSTKDTIKPRDGAIPDAGRRFTVTIPSDVYIALLREKKQRQKELNATDRHPVDVGLSVIVSDALISYLGVGSEEIEMENNK